MDVLVNGEPVRLDGDEMSVERLLDQLNFEQRTGIAVALNYSVVPRSRWAVEPVRNGDEIEIVRATQGG